MVVCLVDGCYSWLGGLLRVSTRRDTLGAIRSGHGMPIIGSYSLQLLSFIYGSVTLLIGARTLGSLVYGSAMLRARVRSPRARVRSPHARVRWYLFCVRF